MARPTWHIPRNPKTLIVVASAARSLRDAIEFLDEDSRADVLDLFADSYGAFNTLAHKTYLGMVQYAPGLWGGIY